MSRRRPSAPESVRPVSDVDWRTAVLNIPIRDCSVPEMPVALRVDVYGVTQRDLLTVPGGADPMIRAVRRAGLDPSRYRASLWEIPRETVVSRRPRSGDAPAPDGRRS